MEDAREKVIQCSLGVKLVLLFPLILHNTDIKHTMSLCRVSYIYALTYRTYNLYMH